MGWGPIFPQTGGLQNQFYPNAFETPLLGYPTNVALNVVQAMITENATNAWLGFPSNTLQSYFQPTGDLVAQSNQEYWQTHTLFQSPTFRSGPMAVYKVTWNFIGSSGLTWTESYFVNTTSAQAAANPGYYPMYPRMKCLHPTAFLRTIRAANVASTRDTYTQVYNNPGAYVDTTAAGPAPFSAAAVISCGALGTRSVFHWWRGLPAAYVVNSSTTGFPNPPAAFNNYITYFFTNYGAQAAGIRVLSPAPKFQIIGLTYSPTQGTSQVQYTVGTGQTPPVWVPGSRVIIALASKKDAPGLNGGWTIVSATNVVAPGTGSFVIRYVLPNQQTVLPINGYVKAQNYNALASYTGSTAALSYYGTHSTKSVFSNSRGSRRAPRLRVLA